jgi:hypothetical protein
MAPTVVERVIVAEPTHAGSRVIASPFQFGVTGEDNLRISVWNALAGCVVAVHGRFLNDQGKIEPFTHTITPTSDRMVTSIIKALGRGFVLNLAVFASAGAPKIGQTFVKVDVLRGLTGATVILGTMLQGYVTAQQGLGWPGSPIQSSLDTPGVERIIDGTTPAPGNPINEVVPTGARWQVLAVRCNLLTDATVANRQPFLRFDTTSGLGYFVQGVSTTIGPSASMFSFWANGVQVNAAITTQPVAPLPVESTMFGGMGVFVDAVNLQAGDRFSQVILLVREWLEANA